MKKISLSLEKKKKCERKKKCIKQNEDKKKKKKKENEKSQYVTTKKNLGKTKPTQPYKKTNRHNVLLLSLLLL